MEGTMNITVQNTGCGASGVSVRTSLKHVDMIDKMMIVDAVVRSLEMQDLDVLMYATAKLDGVFNHGTQAKIDVGAIQEAFNHED